MAPAAVDLDVLATGLNHLDHRLQWQHKFGLAHADHEAVNDGQGQRQPNVHLQAAPGVAGQLERAAQGLDVAPHHVHAHATARQVGDLLGGGKTRLENQHVDGVVGRHHALLHQAPVPGALQHPVAVDAAAIVFNADQNAAGFMLGTQDQFARRRLARGQPLLRRLQAVVERVAHQVHQRVGNFLDHRLVQLGIAAHDLEIDFFAQAGGGVTHHAAKAAEGFAHRHHAQAQGAVANFFNQAVHVQVGLDQAGLTGLAGQQRGARAGNHQLAQQVDHRVQPVGLHADVALLAGRVVTDFLLFAQCGFHHLRGHASLGLQQTAQLVRRHRRHAGAVLLRVQHLHQLVLRDGPNRHQHVTQARRLRQFLDLAYQLLPRGFRGNDVQLAVVHHETEGTFHLFPVGGRLQRHAKTQVAGFRVQVHQRRHGLGAAAHAVHRAHARQIARNGQRVHAVAKRLGAKAG